MMSDIARQFDLPERQSKLDIMLREDGLKDEQVYCICRSTDVSRFMIGCDNCEEWYHGDCINVTEQEANKIRKFFCKKCQTKHSSLKIKYKDNQTHHHKHHKSDKHSTKKKKSRCGECEACYVRENCGRCENCKDMIKFGGSGSLLQKCKKRQCHNFFHLAKKHQLNSVTKEELKKFTIPLKRVNENNDNLSFKKKETHHNKISKTINSTTSTKNVSTPVYGAPSSLSPHMTPISSSAILSHSSGTIPIHSEADSFNSIVSNSSNISKINSVTSSSKMSSILTNRTNKDDSDDDIRSLIDQSSPKALSKEWLPPTSKRSTKISKKWKQTIRKRKMPHDSDSDMDDGKLSENFVHRQCLGPGCVKISISTSKYCSQDCGLKLASARIYSVLPQRIQEWKMRPCEAEDRDRKQLEKIRCLQLTARKALQALDDQHIELDKIVQMVKKESVDVEDDVEGDDETSFVYCVTCGHEVPVRRAIRHMHSCYNKLESQMSFGSMFKTRIEGNNMFCDFFNPANSTYCKRLRVMCPEHTKEPKFSATEVCGFPLTKDIFQPTEQMCCISKKKCVKHYCWEKLRRASIDMERVRQCLKLDELVEQERQLRVAMTNRAGVLGLMLHSTYDHEYAETMQHHHQQQKPSTISKDRNNDHHYHRLKTAAIASSISSVRAPPPTKLSRSSTGSAHQDHGYFSNKTNTPHDRKDDHIYFSNKRHK